MTPGVGTSSKSWRGENVKCNRPLAWLTLLKSSFVIKTRRWRLREGAATERERQDLARAAEAYETLTRKVVALEAEATALRLQARDVVSRVGTLEMADHVREWELKRAVAAFREGALEERISVYERDAQTAADRITALEVENQRLRDQAASFGTARDLDVYKRLWEAEIVPEASYKEVCQKAREFLVDCGFDPAMPGNDDGADDAGGANGGGETPSERL